jgi:hypothetical protein
MRGISRYRTPPTAAEQCDKRRYVRLALVARWRTLCVRVLCAPSTLGTRLVPQGARIMGRRLLRRHATRAVALREVAALEHGLPRLTAQPASGGANPRVSTPRFLRRSVRVSYVHIADLAARWR